MASLAKYLGATRYRVVALHPIPEEPDDVVFTRKDLIRLAESLANKPIIVDHAGQPYVQNRPWAKALPFPENRTLEFRYDAGEDGLVGELQIADEHTNSCIQTGIFKHVSAEYIQLLKGIPGDFTRLSLLSPDVKPRDARTTIDSQGHSLTVIEAIGESQELASKVAEYLKVVREAVPSLTDEDCKNSTLRELFVCTCVIKAIPAVAESLTPREFEIDSTLERLREKFAVQRPRVLAKGGLGTERKIPGRREWTDPVPVVFERSGA